MSIDKTKQFLLQTLMQETKILELPISLASIVFFSSTFPLDYKYFGEIKLNPFRKSLFLDKITHYYRKFFFLKYIP